MRTRCMVMFAATGLVFGQPRLDITEVERIRVDAGDPVPGILERLPQIPLGELSDKAAQAMLQASSGGSESFLRWHLGELIGAATLTEGDLDILAARWAKTG